VNTKVKGIICSIALCMIAAVSIVFIFYTPAAGTARGDHSSVALALLVAFGALGLGSTVAVMLNTRKKAVK